MSAPAVSTHDALSGVFRRWAAADRAPGVAWGLVRAGELVASGGVGSLRAGADAPPNADSVFRIASMTKSFTGAALMALVVDGRVRLDDPVSTHVPELASWTGPTADGPPITVRHLVSMESGLPTDDPWADRHLDMPPDEMRALIGTGATFAWTPGTRFEYSNLGWGLVGVIVERIAGERLQELVSRAILGPLGMTSTTWVRPGSGAVAEPYRVRDGVAAPEVEPLGDGAIAPMGGLWTTVRDLATWVGFLAGAFPPRDDDDDGPLPRWARREMQQLRRFDGVAGVRPSPSGPARVIATGYGIGLGIRADERLGLSVGHSGGLPGYGSHMRWLPAHGVGVIGLSNVTYGSMHAACVEALEVLADRDELGPVLDDLSSSRLAGSASRAAALLSSWRDADADALFADNVGLDEPYARRADEARAIVDRAGELEVEALEPETPMRGTFVTAGGDVRVELGLDHAGRVQWLDLEDRLRPADAPIATEVLSDAVGAAYVVVRPVADLADAFLRWQGEALDRLGRAPAIVPAGHVTLQAFGSAASPLTAADERRIDRVVSAWAEACPPIELRAEALHTFDERVPAVQLARTASLDRAFRDLRERSAGAALPGGTVDGIAERDWVPHLSLAYPRDVTPEAWILLAAWAATVRPGPVTSTALEAELVAYGTDGERRLGRFPLAGRATG